MTLPRRTRATATVVISLFSMKPPAAQTASSSSDTVVIREAHDLLARHQLQRVETVLQPLLSREPEDANALTILAQVRLAQGKQDEATTLLLRGLALYPSLPEANTTLGEILLHHHNPEAMDRFETTLRTEPQNPDARRGELLAVTELAESARESGHPEASLLALQHARISLPDDPILLLNLGVQANELRLLPEASEALTRARKIDPANLEILYALAKLEVDQQHMSAAESDLRLYLTAQPGDASAHFGLGHVLAMLQRADEARAEFERSLAIQPVQTESYYQLGQLELDAQHDDRAELLFRKTLSRDPTHGGALTGMGVISFRAKDYAKAEQYLAAAEKTAPEYGPAHYYRGLSFARLGKKDEADAELRIAAALSKSIPSTATNPQ